MNTNLDTTLEWALEHKYFDVANVLIEHGANVNHKNAANQTLLMQASKEGDIEIVKYLVKNGANIHIETKSNETAFYLACGGYKDGLEVVKYLVEQGADIYARNINNKTGLEYASYMNNNDVKDFLYTIRYKQEKQDFLFNMT